MARLFRNPFENRQHKDEPMRSTTLLMNSDETVIWLLALSLLLVLAYVLPWTASPVASLSPGAYDFAEWASLHPAVRAQSPALLTALLLRLPLTCIALIVALTPSQNSARWLRLVGGGGALALTLAQLPPPEFFISASGDSNYQQQFTLALTALIGSGIALSGVLRHFRLALIALLALAGAAAGWIGMTQGLALLNGFGLRVQVSGGGVIFILLALTCASFSGVAFLRHIKQRDG